MTKKLRYFCTLLLMAVVSVAWAQTYNTVATFNSADVVSSSSYKAYSNDDWSLSFGGNNMSVGTNKNNAGNCVITSNYGTGASTNNNAVSILSKNPIANVSQITFTYNGGSGNTGNIYLAYSTDNSTWTAITLTSGTQGSSATTDMTFQFAEIASAYYAVILDRGQNASSNWRWDNVVVTFDEEENTSAVATTTTIDATGITNTDVYVSAEAGSLSATVTETESGDEVSGATVTWTSSKESVATVDENGVVTLVAAGTTTITAAYAGVSGEFVGSSATYELTVTSSAPYVQPTTVEINMNYEWLGSNNGQNLSADQLPVVNVDDNVTTTITDGTSTRPRGDSDYIRIYKGSTLTFEAPDGYAIVGIEFTTGGTNTWNAPEASPGSLDSKTWTGNAESVVFTFSGSCFISKATITLGEPSTEPTIEANDVEIEYNAEVGNIDFSINNFVSVDGASIVASCESDWLVVDDQPQYDNEGTFYFYCDPNPTNTARTATVTLTYSYGESEVTKDVIVTQAAAPVVYTTIPDLFAAATSTATNVTITFNNWVISAVKGSNAYLTDNQGNGLIIYQSGHGFNVNDVLSGTASCDLVTYQGSAELKNLTASTEGLTVTIGGGTVTEQDIAIADLSGVNTGALVHYDGLTYDGTNLVDGDNNTIKPYSTLYSYTFEEGKTYNVTGIYLQFNTTKEILPRSADDIEEVVTTVTIPIKNGFKATTFSCDKALDFSNVEGITAYIITDENGKTQAVTTVPAGEGLYIEGAAGDYQIPVIASAAAITGNKLMATDGSTTLYSDNNTVYYAFGKQNGKEAFYKVPTSGFTPSANKAVLAIDAVNGAKEMIVIGGDVTGIESIENGTIVNDNYYTIDGKLVKGQPTQKGIYVVNGRKVVIK